MVQIYGKSSVSGCKWNRFSRRCRAADVVADRIVGKPYIEFKIDRERIARYGVNIRDVQDVIEMALGGMNLLESVEGRERYPMRLQYVRDRREDLADMKKLLVPIALVAMYHGASRRYSHGSRPTGDQGRAGAARGLCHHEHARP